MWICIRYSGQSITRRLCIWHVAWMFNSGRLGRGSQTARERNKAQAYQKHEWARPTGTDSRADPRRPQPATTRHSEVWRQLRWKMTINEVFPCPKYLINEGVLSSIHTHDSMTDTHDDNGQRDVLMVVISQDVNHMALYISIHTPVNHAVNFWQSLFAAFSASVKAQFISS